LYTGDCLFSLSLPNKGPVLGFEATNAKQCERWSNSVYRLMRLQLFSNTAKVTLRKPVGSTSPRLLLLPCVVCCVFLCSWNWLRWLILFAVCWAARAGGAEEGRRCC
jgi:hypothetical protein